MTPLRVVFLGADSIAVPLLDALAFDDRVRLVGVFTQPDRPAGRGQKLSIGPIKNWAVAKGIPVFQPEKFHDQAREDLANLNPDVGLVMAYGHILREEAISTPRLGMLNLHTSILPKYRGASPIQTAVASGEQQTGVTLMRIVRKLDAGPVADVAIVPISSLDTAADVEARLSLACCPLVLRNLDGLASGMIAFSPQDELQASYCRRLAREDGTLDFRESASLLAARINGLNPWPSAHFEFSGMQIKCGLADALQGSPSDCGKVMGQDAAGLLVSTGEGTLRMRRLQRPGALMLGANEFLRGFSIPEGALLPSLPMAPLVSGVPFPR